MKDLLSIPETGLAGMQALARWSDEDFMAVHELISAAGVKLFPEKWIAEAVPESPNVTPGQVFSFASMVRSLLWTWSGTKFSLADFISLAVESAEKTTSKNYKFNEVELEVLKRRLSEVLGTRSLRLSSKASEIYSGVERPIRSVSISPELKPVFDHSGGELGAFLVAYTLKVEFAQDEVAKSCFYSMDSNDIDDLIVSLQKAKRDSGDAIAAIIPSGVSIVSATPETSR